MGSGEWGVGSGEWRRRYNSPFPIPHSPLPVLLFLEDHCVFHGIAAGWRVSDHLRHRLAVGRESDLTFEEAVCRFKLDHKRVAFPFGGGLRRLAHDFLLGLLAVGGVFGLKRSRAFRR